MDVVLQRGREGSLLRRHPWVFSGSIAVVTGRPAPGETVEILSHDGEWLARGAWSPESQIRARVWTFDPDEAVDEVLFRRRAESALGLRRALGLTEPSAAFRLCNAENDGLPGVIVDHYAGWSVGQFLSAGAERWKTQIVDACNSVLPARGFFERSDTDGRRKEGLPAKAGLLAGAEPPQLIEYQQLGIKQLVDVRRGHKTGAYLDQAESRAYLRTLIKPGASEVLNAFCYSGGFGLHAAAAGAARVVQLDQSADALEGARSAAELNGLGAACEYLHGDAFRELRTLREKGRAFDVVVLDPPKFASTAAQVERALGAYRDINRLGIQLLRPGGCLLTFSCSGNVSAELLTGAVAEAAADAGRSARILNRLRQAPDHAVGLSYPEGEYLKGLVLLVD